MTLAMDASPPLSGSSLPASAGAEADLEWTFNPWRERPMIAAFALGTTLALVIVLAFIGMPPLVCAALGTALAFSLAPALFPVRCRVDATGVACRGPFGWERRRWEDLRRATPVRGGLLVSPFSEARPMDRYRALLLPLPERQRAVLAAGLEQRLARHGLGPGAASR